MGKATNLSPISHVAPPRAVPKINSSLQPKMGNPKIMTHKTSVASLNKGEKSQAG